TGFMLFLKAKLHFIGPMSGPVVMKRKAVVFRDAASGRQFERIAAIIDPEAQFDGLAGIHPPFHLRHLRPRYGALDDVVLHDELRLAFDRAAVYARARLAWKEMLAHHARSLQ